MKQWTALTALLMLGAGALAQKKPLDHSVYDGWEAIQERALSHNGEWVAFTVNPQEGDGRLLLMRSDGTGRIEIPRGYNLSFSPDNRYLICRIRPTFAETRQARIQKKKPEDMPKDSLAIVRLGSDSIRRIPRVKAYRMPDAGGWLAYHKEKPLPDTTRKAPAAPRPDPRLDSARRVIDSLQQLLGKLPPKVRKKYLDEAEEDDGYDDNTDESTTNGRAADEGGELVWLNLQTGQERVFRNIIDFAMDSVQGRSLVLKTGRLGRDSTAKAHIWWVNTADGKVDTVMRGFGDVKQMRLDEEGRQLAMVAERDSSAKALQKFYKLWYFRPGMDSARLLADRNTAGKTSGWGISENARPTFSKSGKRLMLGVAPVLPPKDTTVPDFEKVNVDIWHYRDGYLQTQQLRNLNRDLARSYLSVYHLDDNRLVQLADDSCENIQAGLTGDGAFFLGTDNRAYRIESQWLGGSRTDAYAVDPATGRRTLIQKGINGMASLSTGGRYVWWYDRLARHYFTWSDGRVRNISQGVRFPLYDEENDVPSEPGPYGVMAWHDNDQWLYVYDRYDVWRLDPRGQQAPLCITAGEGRKHNLQVRFQRLDAEEDRSISDAQQVLFTLFNLRDKTAGLKYHRMGEAFSLGGVRQTYPVAFTTGSFRKAKNADVLSYGTETALRSGDIKIVASLDTGVNRTGQREIAGGRSMYQPNPQQAEYNWMTAELIEWRAYDGKMTQGILYKPEDFDPKKKYPLIAYFYEKLSDGLYRYQPPAPTPSRLNIPFFVSRGYLVLAPDISYRRGQPGQDAFDYIVSGVRHVVKMGIADSTRLGLQGQSWGGYQTAQIITMTPLFRAAWAGAPVANMTSAYGGIRWESGLNRQFQYERTQSRIGATLWERPDLYIRNSPLFHLPKVKTPLVIMHNDADGAVPWYQGIELYTGLRRLGKPVWMLNYNGEAHNLVERKNRKDIQIREQQFFDWLLKDAPAPKWLREGVPAVDKGRDLGLE